MEVPSISLVEGSLAIPEIQPQEFVYRHAMCPSPEDHDRWIITGGVAVKGVDVVLGIQGAEDEEAIKIPMQGLRVLGIVGGTIASDRFIDLNQRMFRLRYAFAKQSATRLVKSSYMRM